MNKNATVVKGRVVDTAERPEARILKDNTLLVVLSKFEDESLVNDCCGSMITVNERSARLPNLSRKTVYLCGDISKAGDFELELKPAQRVFVIRELSHSDDEDADGGTWPVVNLGRVPLLVHGVGVLYRRFFDPDLDHFNRIREEHVFQSLTESTKPGTAHRTGIYLTPVEQDGEGLHFRLLRCSTNLSGPTENFRAHDRHIVDALNQEAACIFEDHAPLNHVLAQIYQNTPATAEQRQTKARISSHADKTKDMPENGIMAFCTFYDQLDKLQPLTEDPFDYGYKGTSGLTKLIFRLKAPVAARPGCSLPPQFTVTLYPDSVFFMPLSTNRLYTHEIRSSALDASQLPTRLGYVVRCSVTDSVHTSGHTCIKRCGKLMRLEPPTPEGMAELRKLYAEENKTDAFIEYGDHLLFSMNQGDYTAPAYRMSDEFRVYDLPSKDNPFEELMASVRFDHLGKGRLGAVLVKPEESRGIPIVRTTTKYVTPAQCFHPIHARLAKQIQQRASLSIRFNNALIEMYTNEYASMGFHSDQALDLEDESFIALCSCYKHPEVTTPSRKLVVESKEPGGGTFEIPLTHNSVVVFSLGTNRRFRHKIVLKSSADQPENPWMGITFRTSKSFVRFRDEVPYFEDGTPLTLASDDQRPEFYALRRRENKETDFIYPEIRYTISESDLMMPEPISPTME